MQIVINIPEGTYELVRHGNKSYTTELELMNAVANGTPLPKGHGDLVDRVCLCDFREWLNTCPKDCDENDEVWFTSTEVVNKIKQYPAVIDADKEE